MPPDVDDGSIGDDFDLLRTIRPDQIIDDEHRGTRRPSSAAFKAPELSVDAEQILLANGLHFTFSLRNHPGFSLASHRQPHRLEPRRFGHLGLDTRPVRRQRVGRPLLTKALPQLGAGSGLCPGPWSRWTLHAPHFPRNVRWAGVSYPHLPSKRAAARLQPQPRAALMARGGIGQGRFALSPSSTSRRN
jgi:hypothetical protein